MFVSREAYRKYSKLAAAKAAAAAAAAARRGGSESDGECVLSAEPRHAPHAADDMELKAMLEESLMQGEEEERPAEAGQRGGRSGGGGGRGRTAGPRAAAAGGRGPPAAAAGAAGTAAAPSGAAAAPPKTTADAAMASALGKLGEPSWEAFSEKLLQQGMAGCLQGRQPAPDCRLAP